MDHSETSPPSVADTGLPKAEPFSPVGVQPASAKTLVVVEPTDRSGIFGHLVKDDADIAGLVAYSIYKQNKLDWLRAFESAKGRAPDDTELGAYIIGEGTIRRLATYRHLAEATLAGNGPDVDGSSGQGRKLPAHRGNADTSSLKTGLIVTYLLIAILFVILLWFAVHSTVASH